MSARYTVCMDGRTAAMNVLIGVMLGLSVPIIGAVVLSQAHPDFRWFDYGFTILFLSIGCAAIGVLVNLPWTGVRTKPLHVSSAHTSRPAAGTQADDRNSDHEDEVRFKGRRTKKRQRVGRFSPPASSRRYAMSRRQALRTLELDPQATDEAASDEAVREAYRRLAMEHHPDRSASQGEAAVAQATRKFQEIRAAYDVLSGDE